MSELAMGGLLIGALVFLVLFGLHIAVALTAVGFAGIWLIREDMGGTVDWASILRWRVPAGSFARIRGAAAHGGRRPDTQRGGQARELRRRAMNKPASALPINNAGAGTGTTDAWVPLKPRSSDRNTALSHSGSLESAITTLMSWLERVRSSRPVAVNTEV